MPKEEVLLNIKQRAEELEADPKLLHLTQDVAALRAVLEPLLADEEGKTTLDTLLKVQEALRKTIESHANVMKINRELLTPDAYLMGAKALAEAGSQLASTYHNLMVAAVASRFTGADQEYLLTALDAAERKARGDYATKLRRIATLQGMAQREELVPIHAQSSLTSASPQSMSSGPSVSPQYSSSGP